VEKLGVGKLFFTAAKWLTGLNMATQTIEFRAAPSQTVTLRLFVVGSDTEVANAAATEATNRKGTYAADFTSVAAGEYQYVATIGTSPIIPLASGYVTLALTTATYQVYDAAKAVIVNDKTGYSLATAPPTSAEVADAVWDEAYSGHTTAGTFGKLMDILRKSNAVIEGTILASPTPTTTTFTISGADYPTGALEHSVLWLNSGNANEQNSPILTTTNNGDGTLSIVLEEALTVAPIAGDTVLIDPTSHVHAISDIVLGVWSALTSGFSVVGSAGRALARLIGLVEDSSGDRFTAKALEEAPSGSSTVTVLPASGVAAGRGETTSLVAYVGETISQSIGVYQADGTTPYDFSGKTLTIIFENLKTGDDVAVVASGSITISGANNNTVTFSYPSAATASQRELGWVLRDEAAPKTVYLRGTLEVRYAPTVG
jgi:hypothetical protein